MPTLMITHAQGNLMLEALAERPFKHVFEVIGMLNRGAAQFAGAGADETARTEDAQAMRAAFVFSNSELRITLDALADLPYRRVQPLLLDLHAQLAQQTATSEAGD